MRTLYGNSGFRDLPGTRKSDDEEGEDYENMAPPYKDLPPKPDSVAPRRPQRAEMITEPPPRPHKPMMVEGIAPEHPPSQPSQATPATPVPWLCQKFGSPGCYKEKKLIISLCLLLMASLLLGFTGLAVTLTKYREVMEELRMLTFQQRTWQENVVGMAGLAGLKEDIDRIRADTNRSLVELWASLDCTKNTCPEGWHLFEGTCYYFSQNIKTWDEARKFCQENYSHLVIISSFAEQNFVSMVHRFPKPHWLGLTDRENEGDWKWLDGSPLTVRFWGQQEPNNMNDEDCAGMNNGGTWNDLPCNIATHWICERKYSC